MFRDKKKARQAQAHDKGKTTQYRIQFIIQVQDPKSIIRMASNLEEAQRGRIMPN
jgi:hypothetical protein